MGMKRRKRVCNSPVPQHEGSKCVTLKNKTALNETEVVSCTMKECPGTCVTKRCMRVSSIEVHVIFCANNRVYISHSNLFMYL